MRILCRICKKNRSSSIEIYHENPDTAKYYCLLDGDLTNTEHKRELKIEDLDTKKKHRYKAVYRKRYREK